MNRATPHLRSLAKQLIISEVRRNKSSKTKNPAAFHHVIERLRPHLATLLGEIGFRTLLWRALAMASGEVAWLSAVEVQEDGSLKGLEELGPQLKPPEFLEGKAALVAHLLGLLVAFMGTSLTTRLMEEIWGNQPHNKAASVTNSHERSQDMRKAAVYAADDVRNQILALAAERHRFAQSAARTKSRAKSRTSATKGKKK